MATIEQPAEAPAAAARKQPYHHIVCDRFPDITFKLNASGHKHLAAFSVIGVSSRDTIRAGLAAVDRSPFGTVFVTDLETGTVLYALSKNVEFVKSSRKKNPRPPDTPPPPPPISDCCQLCSNMGGSSCQPLSDGSCICFGADRDVSAASDVNDRLDTL